MIAIDTLHACDLGVSQDFIGNTMHEYLRSGLLDGSNHEDGIKQLWQRLKKHYNSFKTEIRIHNLTSDMVKARGKPPKVRTKGAECRSLLPFALEISQHMADSLETLHYKTIFRCASSLMNFYLSFEMEPFDASFTEESCRTFCTLLSALAKEAEDGGDDMCWRLKPKVHMMQELGEYQVHILGSPRFFWNYKDEDFVGFVAQLANTAGGPAEAVTAAQRVINRYRASK